MSYTKYQRAPSEEPDEDYTHAPPAYNEASSSRDEAQGLFGAPRSSEDNIPDDFKVRQPPRSPGRELLPSPEGRSPMLCATF